MRRQIGLLCWTGLVVLAPMRTLFAGEAIAQKRAAKTADARRIEQVLAKRLSLDFVETPMKDVAAFLSDVTGVAFILDLGSGEPPRITFKGRDMRLSLVLKLMLKAAGLAYRAEEYAVYISTPARMAEVDKIEKGLSLDTPETKPALTKSVSLDFVDTPMRDVASFTGDTTGLNVILDAKVAPPLTLKVKNMPVRSALIYMARLTALRVYAVENVIVFTDEGLPQGK